MRAYRSCPSRLTRALMELLGSCLLFRIVMTPRREHSNPAIPQCGPNGNRSLSQKRSNDASMRVPVERDSYASIIVSRTITLSITLGNNEIKDGYQLLVYLSFSPPQCKISDRTDSYQQQVLRRQMLSRSLIPWYSRWEYYIYILISNEQS